MNVKISNDESFIAVSNNNHYTYLFYSDSRSWNDNSINFINQIKYTGDSELGIPSSVDGGIPISGDETFTIAS